MSRRPDETGPPPEQARNSEGSDRSTIVLPYHGHLPRNLNSQPLQDTVPGWPPRTMPYTRPIISNRHSFYVPRNAPPRQRIQHRSRRQPRQQSPTRYPTSCLYTFYNHHRGMNDVLCSRRMDRWLRNLPDPLARTFPATRSHFSRQQQPQNHSTAPTTTTTAAASPEPVQQLRENQDEEMAENRGEEDKTENEDREVHQTTSTTQTQTQNIPAQNTLQLPQSLTRGRSSSAPVPPSNSAVELLGPELAEILKPNDNGWPVRSLAGVPVIPPFRHPNPFSQHPVDMADLSTEVDIPERMSSLRRVPKHSQALDNQNPDAGISDLTLPPPILTLPANGGGGDAEQLIPGIRAMRLGHSVQFEGYMPGDADQDGQDVAMEDAPAQETSGENNETRQPARRPFGSHLQQLFHRDSVKQGGKKHGRSDTPLTINSERAAKRVKDILGRARDRLHAVVTPAEDLNDKESKGKDGRKSRLGRLAIAATSRLSSSRSSKKSPAVFTLPPNYIPDKIKMVLISDKGTGKSELVERFKADSDIKSKGSAGEGCTVHTFSYAVDGERVPLEIRDVSSLCDYSSPENNPRPLLMGYLSIVVICFDIQNEASLKSAMKKWKRVSNEYCDSAPVMLLGLKSDLRPRFFTLKLMHLNEPNATTMGQGEEAATELDAIGYFECSANTGEGVVDFFESAMRFCMEQRRQKMAETAVPEEKEKSKTGKLISKIRSKCRK